MALRCHSSKVIVHQGHCLARAPRTSGEPQSYRSRAIVACGDTYGAKKFRNFVTSRLLDVSNMPKAFLSVFGSKSSGDAILIYRRVREEFGQEFGGRNTHLLMIEMSTLSTELRWIRNDRVCTGGQAASGTRCADECPVGA